MAKETLQARANPFILKKVKWISDNDDYTRSDIVLEGVRLFLQKYEKQKGIEIPITNSN